tara:strand:- start:5444 stop:5833 length:390 start_codon:yes stop_codon:yes gene_type:complete
MSYKSKFRLDTDLWGDSYISKDEILNCFMDHPTRYNNISFNHASKSSISMDHEKAKDFRMVGLNNELRRLEERVKKDVEKLRQLVEEKEITIDDMLENARDGDIYTKERTNRIRRHDHHYKHGFLTLLD